ncbi:uncharacterized [Tachysurus ichikawai]
MIHSTLGLGNFAGLREHAQLKVKVFRPAKGIAQADKVGQEIPVAFDEADFPSRVFSLFSSTTEAVMEATLSIGW